MLLSFFLSFSFYEKRHRTICTDTSLQEGGKKSTESEFLSFEEKGGEGIVCEAPLLLLRCGAYPLPPIEPLHD